MKLLFEFLRGSALNFFTRLGIPRNTVLATFVALLLMPVCVLIYTVVIVITSIWNFCALGIYFLVVTQARIENDGLRIFNHVRRFERKINWSEIEEIRQIWKPPFMLLHAILRSGEIIHIEIEDRKALEESLTRQNIPLIKPSLSTNAR